MAQIWFWNTRTRPADDRIVDIRIMSRFGGEIDSVIFRRINSFTAGPSGSAGRFRIANCGTFPKDSPPGPAGK